MAYVDPARRVERLAARLEPGFRAAFLAMVGQVRDRHSLSVLADLLASGRFDEALENLLDSAGQLGTAWSAAFNEAGVATAGVLTRNVRDVFVSFDGVNARAVRNQQLNRLRLVREFSEIQRDATRNALIEGTLRGANPRQQARAFRDSIGLTRRQTDAVANFRRLLQSRDASALSRRLRDRRFDATVRRAIQEGSPLTRAQIDRMVDRYRERFIRHRSEVIARTESLRAANAGTQEAMIQADLPGRVVRTWNTAQDERVRGSHRAMHGQERGLEEPFTSGNGASLMHPGDPNASAEESIQCRCSVSTRVMDLEEATA